MAWWIGAALIGTIALCAVLLMVVVAHSLPPDSDAERELQRRYRELRPRSDGATDVAIEERFSGLLLPLIKKSLPDFGPVFARFGNDLKHEAERAHS